jgi:hypothetical protein
MGRTWVFIEERYYWRAKKAERAEKCVSAFSYISAIPAQEQ